MNFEEKNPQKLYFLIVPSMGETKELVILPLVSDLARKKNMHKFQNQVYLWEVKVEMNFLGDWGDYREVSSSETIT